MENKGLFITFEGGEGAGKTTLIRALSDYLRSKNIDVVCTLEPGGTDFGVNIRKILLDVSSDIPAETEFFLYLADRSYHVKNKILPALKQGKVVLCDRYIDSSIAYQGAGRAFVSLDKINQMNKVATGGLFPDLTFLLEISPKKSLKRINNEKDRFEMENISFHQRVQDGYHKILTENPHRVFALNAENPPQEVYKQARIKLDDIINKFNLLKIN